MPIAESEELRLLARVQASQECAALNVTAGEGDRFGVVVTQRGHPVGVWSFVGGAFVFRNIARWDVLHSAPDVEHALALTIGMARTGRWAQ